MDKAQRAELLRQRFKVKGVFGYVPSGKPRKMPDEPKPRQHIAWPVTVPETPHAPKSWFKQTRAEPVSLQMKRAAKVSPLTKIAAQLPRKLTRVPLSR